MLTEAAYLLRRHEPGIRLLANDVASGVFVIETLDAGALVWMAEFMARYRDLRADLADASVMWVAEQHGQLPVFTIDRRDFGVYRFTAGGSPVLIPD